MMLQAIMGTPLLSWLTRSLAAGGVGRFFLVCHERFLSEAKHCFPDGCELSCAKLEETADQLHVFLSTADEQEEDVIVVTGPAVIDPFAVDEEAFSGAPVESGVSSVSRQALMDALDDTFMFTDFMKEHGIPYTDRDGVYAVSSMQQLAEWKPVLSRGVLYDLAAAGVSIWDYDNTYVEPTVFVGAGAELLPGTVLRGTTSIADGCMIGPNSYLENVKVGENTRVNASQVYDSEIGADTTVGIVDKNINFGCGTVTVNYDRVKKSRTVIDDNAFIGCNANLIAPVHIGEGAYIAAGSTVTDDVPPAALAIARARQQNKRDWANRHKLKEKK